MAAFDDIFGNADEVANDLYARADETAPGTVDQDFARGRMARKLGSDTDGPSQDDMPYNYYVRTRKKLEGEGYNHGDTIAKPNTGPKLDFSSEGIPADQVKPAEKPDLSTEGMPADQVPQPGQDQGTPAPMVGGFPAVQPNDEQPFRSGGTALDAVLGVNTGMLSGNEAYDKAQAAQREAEENVRRAQVERDAAKQRYDKLLTQMLPNAGGDPTQENIIKRTAQQRAGLGRTEAAYQNAVKELEKAKAGPAPTQGTFRDMAERVVPDLIQMPVDTLEAVGHVVGGGLELTGMAPDARQKVEEVADGIKTKVGQQWFKPDTSHDRDFGVQLMQGLISTAEFAGAGALGEAAGMSRVGSIAVAGALPQAEQQYQQAQQQERLNPGYAKEWMKAKGLNVSEKTANELVKWGMFVTGLGIGATEAIPLEHMMERAEALMRLNTASGGGVERLIGMMAKSAGEEGIQEGVQQLLQNIATQGLLDPNQDLTEDVANNALIGAISGALVSGAMGALALRSQTPPVTPPPGTPPGGPGPGPAPGIGGPGAGTGTGGGGTGTGTGPGGPGAGAGAGTGAGGGTGGGPGAGGSTGSGGGPQGARPRGAPQPGDPYDPNHPSGNGPGAGTGAWYRNDPSGGRWYHNHSTGAWNYEAPPSGADGSTGSSGGPGAGAGGGAGGGGGTGGATGGGPGAGTSTPPPNWFNAPNPSDTPRQAKMRPSFQKGLQDAGLHAPNLPFDELVAAYKVVDGLSTGFGRTDLAGRSIADLKEMFDQLTLLRDHGYTPDELKGMSPADIAINYAQAVRDGATKPEGPKARDWAKAPEAELDAYLQKFGYSTDKMPLAMKRAMADKLYKEHGEEPPKAEEPRAGAAPEAGKPAAEASQEPGQPGAAVQQEPGGGGPQSVSGQPGADTGETPAATSQQTGTRDAPIDLRTGADVARAAGVASQTHSPAQGEAHNVAQGYGQWGPFTIAFEAPAGGIRRGTNPRTGEPWEGRVGAATGYIVNGPLGNDGDKLDVYVGGNPGNGTVYVLDELGENGGKFRQTKSFIGFNSPEEAIDAYLKTDNKSAEQIGGVTPMDRDQWSEWVRTGDHTQPARGSEQASTQENQAEVEPEHHRAIEQAIERAGVPAHEVAANDIALAAQLHASGVDPETAFQSAVVWNAVHNGYLTPEEVSVIYGHEALQALELVSAEAGAVPPGGSEAAASEGTVPQQAVSHPAEENGELPRPGAHGAPEGNATASAEPAGGTKATGAEAAGGETAGNAGTERPNEPHGGERTPGEHAAGNAGERPDHAKADQAAGHPEHAEAAGAAAHGNARAEGAQAAEATVHKTPGTRLEWSNLREWLNAAHELEGRAPTSKKYEQKLAHWDALPLEFLKTATTTDLKRFSAFLQGNDNEWGKPPRGQRDGSKWEKVNVEVNNELQRREQAAKSAGRWKEIGKNSDGETLYEDKNGVRSYVHGGIRHTEPVQLRPTRAGTEYATNRDAHPDFKTTEELAVEKPAEKERPNTPEERLRNRIEAAYLEATGGKFNESVPLSKIRSLLDGLSRQSVDAGLLRIVQGDKVGGDKARLGQISDPKATSKAEREAAFSPGGEPFHLLWIRGPEAKSEESEKPARDAHADILKAVEKLQPGQGNNVRIDALKKELPGITDKDIFALAEDGKLVLTPHGHPKREEHHQEGRVIKDSQGNYYSAVALPREKAAANPVTIDDIRKVYDEIREETGFSTVTIGEIIKQSGLPADEVKAEIQKAAQAGIVSIHHTSSIDHSKDPTTIAGEIRIPGHREPFVTVVFKKRAKPESTAAAKEEKSLVDRRAEEIAEIYKTKGPDAANERFKEVVKSDGLVLWTTNALREKIRSLVGELKPAAPTEEALRKQPVTDAEAKEIVARELGPDYEVRVGSNGRIYLDRKGLSKRRRESRSGIVNERGELLDHIKGLKEFLAREAGTQQDFSDKAILGDIFDELDKIDEEGKPAGDQYKTKLLTKMGSKEEKRGRRTVTVPTRAWAVEFERDGAAYRTNWTTYQAEAERWRENIKLNGTTAEGRPIRVDASDPDFYRGVEEVGVQEAPKPKVAPEAPQPKATGGAKGPRKPRERTAGEVAKEAVQKLASAGDEGLHGLYELFGKGKTIGSGPAFDEETYQKAKPFFIKAASLFKEFLDNVNELARRLVRTLRERYNLSREAVEGMAPYIVRFVQDVHDGKIDLKQAVAEAEAEYARRSALENQKVLDGVPSGQGQGLEGGRGTERGDAGGREPGGEGNRVPEEGAGLPGTRGGGSGSAEVRVPGTGAGGRTGGVGKGRARGTRTGVPEGASRVDPADAPHIPATNFRITNEVELGKGSETVKFNDNLNAIRVLKAIEGENRRATPEEQRALARYVGWGGLANAFADPNGQFKPGWEERGRELASLLTADELRTARASTRNAHYTSKPVIDAMWKAAQQLGFKGGLTFELSAGTGNFIGLVPQSIAGETRFIAIERDSITARIAKLLYPQETVLNAGTQEVPIPDGEAVLNIGNPPFGSESLLWQFKPEYKGSSIHNQFFHAGVDALRPGGLHIAVVSHYLMDAADPIDRMHLMQKAKLIGAIRLPDTAFKENARTEVVTDIVILQRLNPVEQNEMEAIFEGATQTGKGASWDKARKEAREKFPAWVNTAEISDPLGGEPMKVNSYFAQNPHMVMGRHERSGKMRQQGELNVKLPEGANLTTMLDKAVDKLPHNVIDLDKEVIDRSIERHRTMSESLEVAVAGHEPGHVEMHDGKLRNVYERETPTGGIELARRELTPETPWSPQLYIDDKGRWFTLEARVDEKGKKVKEGRGNVYDRKFYPENKVPATLQLGEARYARLREIVNLRDLLKRQLVLEANDAPAREMESNRSRLADAYTRYVAEHGLLNDAKNNALISQMPDGGLVQALEFGYRPGVTAARAARTGGKVVAPTATRAPILSRRVVPKFEEPTKADSPHDALQISLSQFGRVNIDHIAKLLGATPEEAASRLQEGEKALIYWDPEASAWDTRERYLTGNVRQKLNAARAAGMERNVRDLEGVQPAAWAADQVTPVIGSNWIKPQYYEDFARHLIGGEPRVLYSTLTNAYQYVNPNPDQSKTPNWDVQLGEGRNPFPFDEIYQGMLNSRVPSVFVWEPNPNGGDPIRRRDQAGTELVRLKANEIENEFKDWVFQDGDRRNDLVKTFNDKFNTRVTRQHDGSHLVLPGKVPDTVIALRRHQKNAVWRTISERFALLDHVVGAGKTFTAIARIMERRRMGLSRKPMVVVPNHLVEQWAQDVYRLYPGAKVLAAGKNDFERKNRRRLFAKIATGDFDIIVVPHSSFGFILISPETERRFLEEELRIALAAVKEAEEEAAAQGIGGRRKPFNVKQAEQLVENIGTRLASLRSRKKDRIVSFEQMGVDDLTVDECFPYDTPILTDIGWVQIGDVVENKLPVKVASYNVGSDAVEWKPVVRWIPIARNKPILKVIHERGHFICTVDHKIWTDRGYIEAQALLPTDRMHVVPRDVHTIWPDPKDLRRLPASIQDLRAMRRRVQLPQSGAAEQSQAPLLQQPLCGDMEERTAGTQGSVQWVDDGHSWRFAQGPEVATERRADEGEQSHEGPARYREDEPGNEGSHLSGARRQLEDHSAAADAGGPTRSADGIRDRDSSGMGAIHQSSELLQGRSGVAAAQTGDRGGWQFPPDTEVEVPRQAQDFRLERSRVVRVEVFEPGSDGRSGEGGIDYSTLYDIEVEDNHNFIAAGVLVSNCHEFKNLFYSSRMVNVRGMGDRSGSQKAFDLYNKIRVLRESPTGSVVFLTGTPISNSAVEMYTMMRYLAADELKALGIEHFDAWRAQSVSASSAYEPTESGGLKEVTRLGREWSNMRALMELYYSFTDAVPQEDITKWYAQDNGGKPFPVPRVKGGKDRQEVVVKPTPAQEHLLAGIVAGFNRLPSIQDPDERNRERLILMDRARKVSLDARAVDPSLATSVNENFRSDEKGGKLDRVADEVARIHKVWTGDKGTQLVFLDRGVKASKQDLTVIKEYDKWAQKRDEAAAAGDEGAYRRAIEEIDKFDPNEIAELRRAQQGGWNAYDQLRQNLIDRGVPDSEIRYIQEANSDAEKKAIFDDVNDGLVRVLIGSTPKMGAGTNVQKRLVALHHVDVTWKPSDIEQREGRIIRQGNDLLDKYGHDKFEVEVLAYVTERTVDAKMWSLNSTKLKMINGIRKYTGAFNMEFEDEDAVSMAEIAALASGDPLLQERVKLGAEIDKLELQEKGHRRRTWALQDEVNRAERAIRDNPERIEAIKRTAAEAREALRQVEQAADARSVTVEGQKHTTALDALRAAQEAAALQQGGNDKARYSINIDGRQYTNKTGIEDAVYTALGDQVPFEAVVDGETIARRSKLANIIAKRVDEMMKNGRGDQIATIGRMFGSDLKISIEPYSNFKINGVDQVEVELLLDRNGGTFANASKMYGQNDFLPQSGRALIDRLLEEVNSKATSTGSWLQSEIDEAKAKLPTLQGQLGKPFARADELKAMRERLTEVTRILADRTRAAESGAQRVDAGEPGTDVQVIEEKPLGSIEHESAPDEPILRLPFKEKWGNPRFDPDDARRAIRRLDEIANMDVRNAPWSDVVQAKRDIDEIFANLYFYKAGVSDEMLRDRRYGEISHLLRDRDLQQRGVANERPSILSGEDTPEDLVDFSKAGRDAVDHLLTSRRRGILDLLRHSEEKEPKVGGPEPERIGETQRSGFYFPAGRELANVPDTVFSQGGQAVINWLRQRGVSVAEIRHFQLDEKFARQKPVTREEFASAIAERMFDFRRKTKTFNPERSPLDYDEGGTRAFSGPRIPGRGVYFERTMAFPKKLKGGEPFAPGNFQSPHWERFLPGAWASWRGSIRDVPGWGRMVVGEEGQTDYMQGAMGHGDDWTGRRPRVSPEEYLAWKAQRAEYEKVMDQARQHVTNAIWGGAGDFDTMRSFRDDLVPTEDGREHELHAWTEILDRAREHVRQYDRPGDVDRHVDELQKLEDLRMRNEEFFAPGARAKYVKTEKSFTPETPIDETYVRTMVRDLIMHAVKEKADSIAISTSDTTNRIQANTSASAAHFYDQQLKTALERELRRWANDPSIQLEQVALPKAMGGRKERPYTVWAARLPPSVYEAAKRGLPVFKTEGERRTALTSRAEQAIDQIKAAIEQHIREMVGDKVKIEIVDSQYLGQTLSDWGALADGQHDVGEYQPRRLVYSNGAKIPLQGIIRIALHNPSRDTAANHEAVHALIDLAATDQEVEVLKRERPRNRKLVQQHLGISEDTANSMIGFEVDAVAGEAYMHARDNGRDGSEFKLHVALRNLFERIWRMLRRLGNAIRGLGFQTSEDIFGRMHRGEMADRAMRDTPGIDTEGERAAHGLTDAEQPLGSIDDEMRKLRGIAHDTTQEGIKKMIEAQRPKTISERVIRDVVATHEDGSRSLKQWVGDRQGFLESDTLWAHAKQLAEQQKVPVEAAYTHLANKVFDLVKPDGSWHLTREQALTEMARQETEGMMRRLGVRSEDEGPSIEEPPPLGSVSMSHRQRRARTAPRLQEQRRTTGFVRAMADKMIDVLNLEREIEAATGTTIPESRRPYLAETLFHGRAGERIQDIWHNQVEPIIDDLKRNGVDLSTFGDYLYAAHAPRRNRIIAGINPRLPDGGSGIDTATARATLNALNAGPHAAVLQRNAQRVYQMLNAALQMRVAYGLMTQQQANEWRRQYGPEYVPLRGFEEFEGGEGLRTGPGAGFNVRGREAQSALGRRSEAMNPFVQSALTAADAVIRGEKNRVFQAFHDLARSHPDPSIWSISNTTMERRINPATGQVETVSVPVDRSAENVLTGKLNGREQSIIIHRPQVAYAMKNLGVDQANSFERALRWVTRNYAKLRTAWNPEFILKNFQRDQTDALLAVSAHHGAAGVGWYTTNLPHAVQGSWDVVVRGVHSTRWSHLYDQYRLAGGKIAWITHRGVDQILTDMQSRMTEGNVRAALLAVPRMVEALNEAFENATRMNLFATAKHFGASDMEAASLAREGTLNFDRQGGQTAFLRALFPFFNANAQANLRFARLLRGATIGYRFSAKTVRFAMGGMILAGFLAALFNRYMGGDDKDKKAYWDQIPEWEKKANIIFMTGKQDAAGRPVYVKMPMFAEGMFPWLAGGLAADVITGHHTIGYAAKQMRDSIVNILPVIGSAHMGVLPPVIDPLVSLSMNENWYGGRIHPDPSYFSHEAHEPKSQVKFPWTPDRWQTLAEWIGRTGGGDKFTRPASWLDMHPEDVQFLVHEAFGGAWSFFAGGESLMERWAQGVKPTDIDVRDYPVLRQYWGHNYDSKISRDFTEARQKALDAAESVHRGDRRPETLQAAQGAGIAKSYSAAVKPINAQEKRIRADKSLSLPEVERRIYELEQRRHDIQRDKLHRLEERGLGADPTGAAPAAPSTAPSAPPPTPSSAKPATLPAVAPRRSTPAAPSSDWPVAPPTINDLRG